MLRLAIDTGNSSTASIHDRP